MNQEPNPSYEKHLQFIESIKNASEAELDELINKSDEGGRKEIAMNGRLTDVQFLRLVADESPQVRCALPTNEGVPASILVLLAQDKEWNVRWAVAESQNSSVDVLRTLLEDEVEAVRTSAQEHIDYYTSRN